MSVFFERRLLTKHILETIIEALEFPVDLAQMPAGGGWLGQPRADGSNFRPYSVLTPLTAGTSEGGWDTPQSEWLAPYAVTTYGAAPQQTEWQADLARLAMGELRDDVVTLGDAYGEGTILQVWIQSMGTLTKSADTVDYGFWGQTDVFSIRLSRN